MTQSYKRAILTLAIWAPVLAIFAGLFFLMGGGPGTFVGDRPRFVIVAVLFLLGYIAYFTMMHLTRARSGERPFVVDERDERIAGQACGGAFLAVLGYVYFVCILLHLAYESEGVMPVGWMWFLGYSAIFMGYVTHAAITLLLNSRMGAHAKS